LDVGAVCHSSRDVSASGLGSHISISGCRTHLGTLSLNSPWSKTPDWLLESNIFVVLILKHLEAILPPNATGVRENRSAIRGLSIKILNGEHCVAQPQFRCLDAK